MLHLLYALNAKNNHRQEYIFLIIKMITKAEKTGEACLPLVSRRKLYITKFSYSFVCEIDRCSEHDCMYLFIWFAGKQVIPELEDNLDTNIFEKWTFHFMLCI